jgi:hypothetical protein
MDAKIAEKLKTLTYRNGRLDCARMFRLTKDELVELAEACKELDMSLGDYVMALHRFVNGGNK